MSSELEVSLSTMGAQKTHTQKLNHHHHHHCRLPFSGSTHLLSHQILT